MKSKTAQTRRRAAYGSALLLLLLQIGGTLFVRQPVLAEGSPAPNGPVKTFIITYDSLPGEPTKATTVQQKRAKYYWQKNRVMSELSFTKGYKKVLRNLTEMPTSIVQVDAQGEAALRANKRIKTITENRFLQSNINEAIPVMGGTVANGFSDGSTNFTGADNTVVVIDSGFNLTHSMISGAVVSEACYSMESHTYTDVIITSGCPGGAASSTASGSSAASDCSGTISNPCGHGTAVASAAAGQQATISSVNYSGVAKGAKLVLIKILTKWQEISGQADWCNDGPSTVSTCWQVDLAGALSGLNRVIELQNNATLDDPIASVNMSFGLDQNFTDTTSCDALTGSTPYIQAMATLRTLNIAPIVAAGNSGNTDTGNGQDVYAANANKLGWPACLSNAVAVSSSAKDDEPAYYTQAGPRTDIFAPGGDQGNTNDNGLSLANLSGGVTAVQGTSFAAPVTAGAWAVMREKNPTATVATVLRIMQEEAVALTDDRSGYTTTAQKRLALADALAGLTGKPAVSSATPVSGSHTEGDQVAITVNTSNATSCAIGSASASVSGGVATITVTATAGTQAYTVTCSDASGYAAQTRVGFVAAATTTDPYPSNPSAGNNGDVLIGKKPGTPNTGFSGLLRNNTVITLAITTIAAVTILYIARRYTATSK